MCVYTYICIYEYRGIIILINELYVYRYFESFNFPRVFKTTWATSAFAVIIPQVTQKGPLPPHAPLR